MCCMEHQGAHEHERHHHHHVIDIEPSPQEAPSKCTFPWSKRVGVAILTIVSSGISAAITALITINNKKC